MVRAGVVADSTTFYHVSRIFTEERTTKDQFQTLLHLLKVPSICVSLPSFYCLSLTEFISLGDVKNWGKVWSVNGNRSDS